MTITKTLPEVLDEGLAGTLDAADGDREMRGVGEVPGCRLALLPVHAGAAARSRIAIAEHLVRPIHERYRGRLSEALRLRPCGGSKKSNA
jgi:hypothetical protein